MKVFRVTESTFDKAIDHIKGTMGFDIETSSTNNATSRVSVMQFYSKELDCSFLFPIEVVDAHITPEQVKKLLKAYQMVEICGHYLYFDVQKVYGEFGVLPKRVAMDTYILACMRQCPDKRLKTLAPQADISLLGKLSEFGDMMDLSEEDLKTDLDLVYSFQNVAQVKYMAYDPYLPFVVYPMLYREDLEKAYKIELDVIPMLAKASADGLIIDDDLYHKALAEVSEIKDNLQAKVDALVGYPIKVNSTAQLQKALFEERGLPETPIRTSKGACSTSEESLKYLEGDELVDTVLELKHAISVNSGAQKVPQYITDGKIHPQFLQIGMDGTSRMYSTKPSLNQWTWEMRGCIVPKKGNKLVHADWKCAELYIACYFANQENLLEVYRSGGDAHSYLSGLLLGVENPSKEERNVSKVLTFATMYGSEGGAVSRKLRCSEDEAKALVQRYLQILSSVKNLRDKVQAESLRTHVTRTIFGRPRYLENMTSAETVEKGKRQAFNTMIQGSCADLQKIAIAKLAKYLSMGVEFKFTVFDSFLLEVPEDFSNKQIEEVLEDISDFSEYFPNFKLRYDYGVAYDWRSAYELC